ncbi:hypothetical protein [Edaphobacter modestus]|uniref:Uncharacterized protein n=1 Tax=Edaphobacter modestus TaxID=388466 RepID=A0A4Q7XYY1_9BACT|nr:hypothetical protein [Edaphobacter modestus]RZU28991.1 hypothetical protein BDD14_6578 [Edaphobacter modestus]
MTTAKPKAAAKKASRRKAKTARPDIMPTMDRAEFNRLLRRADFEEELPDDRLLLTFLFFKAKGDALISAMEALRYEIVKRELDNMDADGELDDEESTYVTIWNEEDMPEQVSGLILIEADSLIIRLVLEAIYLLPIVSPGILRIPHEDEELRDMFADFEPQIEIVVAGAKK